MPKRTFLLAIVGLSASLACCGCELKEKLAAVRSRKPEKLAPPPHVEGTVAEFAALLGGGPLPVQGYGLTVGLGRSGSAEIPPHLHKHLTQVLLKHKVNSPTAGTDVLTPERMLRDMDTAVVLVGAAIPPGAPVGTRFDISVVALSKSATRSLDGGTLMPTDLRLAVGGIAMPGGPTRALASADGSIFVNPFIDPTKPAEAVKRRAGRIIGGGRVKRARPIRLRLRQADYARCDLIQRRINERFQRSQRVANALSPSTIGITIPRAWRGDYKHFLRLVTHLPLRAGPGVWEAHARKIAAAMVMPDAEHDDLALVWEAMGRQVVPLARDLYTSKRPSVAFHAARTGLRLGDEMAATVMLRFAKRAGSPFQTAAIEELGWRRELAHVLPQLRTLVDDESESVRVAAYEALLKHGDRSMVRCTDVSGLFRLDVVRSTRNYVVYATRAGEPKIVLFGRDMAVAKPIFFNPPDDLVTINARSQDEKLAVFRKIPRTGTYSDTFHIDFSVEKLITTLGSLPDRGSDGKIVGMGLTHGQVVGVLYRMCRQGDICAKFALQPLTDVQGIYRGVPAVGRPDMPDD